MLKYRINTRKFNKTSVELTIETISFVDFTKLGDEENENIGYDGSNKDRFLVTCECSDIDKIKNGSTIHATNTLYLDYGNNDMVYQDKYVFDNNYQVIGVNNGTNSFSFYLDKYFTLKPTEITSSLNYGFSEQQTDNIFLYFEESHYFDVIDYVDNSGESPIQKIPIYFRYVNNEGERIENTINFRWYSPNVLVTSYDEFDSQEKKDLYELIFKSNVDTDKVTMDVIGDGDLSAIEVYRDNFLFTEKTNYVITFQRALAHINVPIANTFETNLVQAELIREQFVDAEKKKAINRITDIEKDVYYPCISNLAKNKFTDVYTIKFNLHFREHRTDDWLVENDSFWNCIEKDESTNEQKIVRVNFDNGYRDLTSDNLSDLLCFLNFTNDDVRYQKNKLKKSFLRLLFYDSTNPGNQNLIGYSTIFFDTGNLFAKFAKYYEDGEYIAVGMNKKECGKYTPLLNKLGIRVDRENKRGNDDETRLSSQFVVKSKNTSRASSEGFYLYIWKDNDSPLPQDLYMKVEFNHAGYGRTVPFMMPYWDSQKWNGTKKGIKTFEEILEDWNSTATADNNKNIIWNHGSNRTDGHYGIRQYTKFSYIHLKYQYDKETDKHIYYLDPDTYGNSVTKQQENEIVINLYEAKIGE